MPGETEPGNHDSDRGRPRWRAWRSVREILGIIWSDAEPFVKRRLISVLLLVIAASVLTALGPLALKWLVDGFTGQVRNSPSPFLFIGAYVLSQFLARTVGEIARSRIREGGAANVSPVEQPLFRTPPTVALAVSFGSEDRRGQSNAG